MGLTYFYAEWFGLLITIVGLSMLVNRRAMLEVVRELVADRALLFVVALFTLLIGLVIVLTHNLWTGGLLTIVVTLLGWLLVLRAVLILFLPHGTLAKLVGWVRLEQTYYILAVAALIIGVYMTWNGFWPATF